LVPRRVGVQISIALGAIVAVPLSKFLASRNLPEIQQFWAAHEGMEFFNRSVISDTIDVTLLAAISVLVTFILYYYSQNLSKAKKMGQYHIEGEIGRGGMGVVYKARHSFLLRPTAIKVMTPTEGDVKAAVARFEQEVKLASSLTHPNTITIFDYGHNAGYSFYYAMELLDGMDLERLVRRFGPLPANRVLFILNQVCGALGEAHHRGIIHRDIKPSNIFLTQRGGLYDFVKVLDFGLAKYIRDLGDPAISRAGALLGTPRYISPESVHSKAKVDERTDLYMLGSVIYWLLTGQPPFGSSSSVDLIVDHVKNKPAKPSSQSELAIPQALDEIVMKCLEKKPEKRFQNPQELSKALQKVPIGKPWDQRQAKEWWSLHLPIEETSPHIKLGLDIPEDYEPVKTAFSD